jgi:hypothetical protein
MADDSKYSVFPVKAPPLYTPLNPLPTANFTPDVRDGMDGKTGFDGFLAPYDLTEQQQDKGFSEGSFYLNASRQDGSYRYGLFGNATNSSRFPTDAYHASIEPTKREQNARTQTLFGLGFSKLTSASPLSKTRKLDSELRSLLEKLLELHNHYGARTIYNEIAKLIGDPAKVSEEVFISTCKGFTNANTAVNKKTIQTKIYSLINYLPENAQLIEDMLYLYSSGTDDGYRTLFANFSTLGSLLDLYALPELPSYEKMVRNIAKELGLSDKGEVENVSKRIDAHLAWYYQQDPSFKNQLQEIIAPICEKNKLDIMDKPAAAKSLKDFLDIAASISACVSSGDTSKCQTVDYTRELVAKTMLFFIASTYLAEKNEMARESQLGLYFKFGEPSILQQFSISPTPFNVAWGLGGYYSRPIGSALLLLNAEVYGADAKTPYNKHERTSLAYALAGAEMEIPLGNGKIVPSAAINYKLNDGTDNFLGYYEIEQVGAPMWLTGGLKYNFNLPGLEIFEPETPNAFSLEAMLSSSLFADSNKYAEGNETRGSFGANGFIGLSEKTALTASGGVVFVSPRGDNRKWRWEGVSHDSSGNEVHTIRENTGSRFGGMGVPMRFSYSYALVNDELFNLRLGGIAGLNYTPDRDGSELFLGVSLSGDIGINGVNWWDGGQYIRPDDNIRPVGGEW